ncbi:MAG: sugar ABC transporter permease [Candidatus Eiseniibacteriota bacterium]|nr:MAG: sugar ABC transporter permease [Candidatus Eisenbacteria bacterium]
MLVVVLYPLIYNFVLAFKNMSMYHFHDARFVGLRNFAQIFRETELYLVFGKTIIWTAVNVFFHVTLGVAIAVVLNGRIYGSGIFRALLILPWAIPQYISALTWKGMFNHEYGAVNLILSKVFHLAPIPWFSDATWAFIAPIITNVWLGFPFMMIVALGGLQSIPHELYEAAELDGAGALGKLRNVTLPLLKPILAPAIVLGTVWTFNNMNVIWLVTGGGLPADKTHILVTYIYKAAFTYYRYSYAAAFSVIVFFLLLGFTFLFMKYFKVSEAAFE